MATIMQIRCCSCAEEFPIYYVNANHDDISCPNCGAVLDHSFTDQILTLFGDFNGINNAIHKSHMERGTPMFEISLSRNTYLRGHQTKEPSV